MIMIFMQFPNNKNSMLYSLLYNTNSKPTYRQILGYNNPILRQTPLTWIILSVVFVYRTVWN